MSVDIVLNTPLADALNSAIHPKLEEFGWATGGPDDNALTEYIILMLVNGKTQNEVSEELAGDLLNLTPEDNNAREFSKWLFETISSLSAQFGSVSAQAPEGEGMAGISHGDSTTVDGDQDMEMNIATDGTGEINAPTGPKAMRNGSDARGGRGKRMMLGQINRQMDRTQDSVLHRVRGANGTERINSHARAPPTGPRGNTRMPGRGANTNRAASIAHGMGMGAMLPGPPNMNGGMNGPLNGMNGWGMPGQPPQQVDMMQRMLEAQAQMLAEMQQQMLVSQAGGSHNGGGFNTQGRGRSLHERSQYPNRGNFRGGRGGYPHHQNGHNSAGHPSHTSSHSSEGPKNGSPAQAQGEDAEMDGVKRESLNPEDTVCKFNLRCTNSECKFAHQSPAAPPGTTVDISDVCTYGAACKNRKCVGRHPSPATKVAHQSEQDCKFWPNCQNPRCTFRHPSTPPCRNGGDCKVEGCEFTHTQTMCKFKPCTNRFCKFKHEDGQRGTFSDKVWVADGVKEHPSERKFADDKAQEEVVLPGSNSMAPEQQPNEQTMEG